MKFEGGFPVMTSIGESLRRERLRRNLQLEQIASELKISPRMLAAIEAEDFQKLPGGVFAKNFVRQYAHVLGLDEGEMAAEVDRVLHPPQSAENSRPEAKPIPLPRLEGWQSVGDGRNRSLRRSSLFPALMWVVLVMLICSGIYAFWQRPRRVAATHPAAPQAAESAHSIPQNVPVQPVAVAPPAAPQAQPAPPAEAPPPAAAPPQTAEAADAVPKPDANKAAAPETPAVAARPGACGSDRDGPGLGARRRVMVSTCSREPWSPGRAAR